MDKYYGSSLGRVIACVPILARCLEFKVKKIVKHFSHYDLPNKRWTLYYRLTSSALHYATSSLAVLIFTNTGVGYFAYGFISANEREPCYLEENLEP